MNKIYYIIILSVITLCFVLVNIQLSKFSLTFSPDGDVIPPNERDKIVLGSQDRDPLVQVPIEDSQATNQGGGLSTGTGYNSPYYSNPNKYITETDVAPLEARLEDLESKTYLFSDTSNPNNYVTETEVNNKISGAISAKNNDDTAWRQVDLIERINSTINDKIGTLQESVPGTAGESAFHLRTYLDGQLEKGFGEDFKNFTPNTPGRGYVEDYLQESTFNQKFDDLSNKVNRIDGNFDKWNNVANIVDSNNLRWNQTATDFVRIRDPLMTGGMLDQISKNRDKLRRQSGRINVNAGNISAAFRNMSSNAGNISSNTGNISSNKSNISSNKSNISSNADSFTGNAERIYENVESITKSAERIDENSLDIESLQEKQEDLSAFKDDHSLLNHIDIENHLIDHDVNVLKHHQSQHHSRPVQSGDGNLSPPVQSGDSNANTYNVQLGGRESTNLLGASRI